MSAGDTSYYDEGYYCDYEAPYNPPHAGVVEHRCGEVFAGIADGSAFGPQKLARAKKQYLGQLSIAGENRENRIMALARATLFRGNMLSDKEIADAIDAIQPDDISTIASALCNASSLTFK